jgi:hypothetical protein
MENYKELSGGKKQMWLRQHRDEVLEFYDKHGAEATKEQYNLLPSTLDSILKDKPKPFTGRFSRQDELQLRLNMTNAEMVTLRTEVRELKELFLSFQDSVSEQLKQKFLLPLLQAGIRVDSNLQLKPQPDVLEVKSLLRQAKGQSYDILNETKEIVDDLGNRSLPQQCEDISERMIECFTEAVKKGEWRLALYIYMASHDRPWPEETDFTSRAKEWLTKVEQLLL